MSKIVQTYRASAYDSGDGQITVALAHDHPRLRGAFTTTDGRPAYSTITVGSKFLDVNFFEAEAIVTVLSEVLAGKADAEVDIPVYAPIEEDL